jgi:hypothetical protein
MSIPKACTEAASTALDKENARLHPEFPHLGEARARRVILALAGELPESAVEAAITQYFGAKWRGRYQETNNGIRNEMRAAIIDALKDIAGETP